MQICNQGTSGGGGSSGSGGGNDPDCSPFLNCTFNYQELFYVRHLQNCTESLESESLGNYIAHWEWSHLNDPGEGYLMDPVSMIPLPCPTRPTDGEYFFHVALGREDMPDYSDPGKRIFWAEYTDRPEWHDEIYCYAIYIGVACSNGNILISRIVLMTQEFKGQEPSSWPPTYSTSTCFSPTWSGSETTQPVAGTCVIPTNINTTFLYTLCHAPATFTVYH